MMVPPAHLRICRESHYLPCLSDEKVWYGAIHNHPRSLDKERMVNDDGTWTHAYWLDGMTYEPFGASLRAGQPIDWPAGASAAALANGRHPVAVRTRG